MLQKVGIAGLVLCLLGMVAPSRAIAAEANTPSVVILVRHAEPGSLPANDPGLTASGQRRAHDLAAALQFANLTAVLTSTARRARETAQPLVDRLGLVPIAVPVGTVEEHVASLTAAVRGGRGAVLVVGHSNTVPALIASLGGPRLPDLCDVHDRMFVLGLFGEHVHLIRSRYGAAQSDSGPDCP
ncbi:MAG: SixA phosphatase family protein [Xanthobacteraceae bacterium]